MRKCIIKGSGLCKTFEDGQILNNVLRNLDVEIYENDFTVIMGSSGSGKSTLLYSLSGMDMINSGTVQLGEYSLTGMKENKMAEIRKSEIGFIFQEPNLLEDFTVFENVVIPGYLGKDSRAQVNETAEKLLKRVDMWEHRLKYPSQLSGGQKQRAAIARSLIHKPMVLFTDEPTGALNASSGENVLDLLTDIHKSGQSIVMVTHDIKAACRGNRILFIHNGKIDADLRLDQFDAATLEARQVQVFDFLNRRGW